MYSILLCNVFYSTSFKNYPSFSLQVPSILSILEVWKKLKCIAQFGFGLSFPDIKACWNIPNGKRGGHPLKGLSHEIDFENCVKNLQNLA
jgi:hypothetical protein